MQTDRARLEAAAWRARFEDLLEGLPPAERQETALHLAELVDEIQTLPSGAARRSREDGTVETRDGVAIGRDVVNRAQGSAVSAGVINGGVHLSNPSGPGSVSY